jgi:WhiB family transcriptional regulator, redox-sensing transcriptional regulator
MRWQDFAACAGMDTEMFFPVENGNYERLRRAREICERCSVRMDCLIYAVETGSVGIWGGMDTKERRQYARDHDLI